MMVTEDEITENIKRVNEGKPLTIPLALLNGKFKKRYFRCSECNAEINGDLNLSGFCRYCLGKLPEYRQLHQGEHHSEYQKAYYHKHLRKRRKWAREYQRKKYKIPKSQWRV